MVEKKKVGDKKVNKSVSVSDNKAIKTKEVAKKKNEKTAKTSNSAVVEKVAIKKLKKEVKDIKKDNKEEKKSDNKIVKKEEKTQFLIGKNKVNNEGKIGIVENNVARATGHRKRSIAKVICKEKSGNLLFSVNDKDYKQYFTKLIHQDIVYSPFAILGINSGFVVRAEVFGGGKTGQADALKLGLSRCLTLLSEEYGKILRKNSFLTRDSRIVEPKKYGLKKARKKEQFSKR